MLDYFDVMDLTAEELREKLLNIPIEKIDPEQRVVVEDALYSLSDVPDRRLAALGIDLQRTQEEKAVEAKRLYLHFKPFQEAVGYGSLTKWHIYKALTFFAEVTGYDDTSMLDDFHSQVDSEIDHLDDVKRHFRYVVMRRMERERMKEVVKRERHDYAIGRGERINWNSAYRKYLSQEENEVRKLFSLEPKHALPFVIMATDRTGLYLERTPIEDAKRFDVPLDDLVRCAVALYLEADRLVRTGVEKEEADFIDVRAGNVLTREFLEWRNELNKWRMEWMKGEVADLERMMRDKILHAWSNFHIAEPTMRDVWETMPSYRFGVLRQLSDSSVAETNKVLDHMVEKGLAFRIRDKSGQGIYFY